MSPRHRFAILLAALAFAASIAVAHAEWPTTCVDLNDAIERDLGNEHNVGIYQGTFGEGAEEACRRDHGDDVRATFAWAFPPAPEPQPVPPQSQGHIDAGLQHAWHLISTTDSAYLLDEPDAAGLQVRWGALPGPGGQVVIGAAYDPRNHTIIISSELGNERPEALAALLAHELLHAVLTVADWLPAAELIKLDVLHYCLYDELLGLVTQANVWTSFGIEQPITDLEWTHHYLVTVLLSQPLGDADGDLSDWQHMLDYMRALGYYAVCAPLSGPV